MRHDFLDTLTTEHVAAAQAANGVREHWENLPRERRSDRLTPEAAAFIAARDSFYLASVGAGGWPYIQHRGGPPGFLNVLDATTLGFADFRGNRQYISLGNLAGNDRVALFLMDYPNRARLKLLARAEVRAAADDPALLAALTPPGYRARPERAILLHLVAFDWNCAQHITPRYTPAEIHALAELTRDAGE